MHLGLAWLCCATVGAVIHHACLLAVAFGERARGIGEADYEASGDSRGAARLMGVAGWPPLTGAGVWARENSRARNEMDGRIGNKRTPLIYARRRGIF
jgi:hypothetical protein